MTESLEMRTKKKFVELVQVVKSESVRVAMKGLIGGRVQVTSPPRRVLSSFHTETHVPAAHSAPLTVTPFFISSSSLSARMQIESC